MTTRLSPWRLGATLYMPATRTDIADVILKNKIPGLRSLVVCFEDAINDCDIPQSLINFQNLLTVVNADTTSNTNQKPLVFIRPRNSAMGLWLKENVNLAAVTGFVIPKFTQSALSDWWDIVKDTHLCMMPTLETEEVFDQVQMRELATLLVSHPCRHQIVALRIGGNDLMSLIALRRARDLTLYDGPMGYVIKMLIAVFASRGFALTAPVCEHIDHHEILAKELALDVHHGLVGKTAIHSNQVAIIEKALRVNAHDYADAMQILNTSQAVFKSQGAMCEPATHRRWALVIKERAQIYGINGDTSI